MSLLSLVLGALCFHLIYVWIDNEINTDKFHKNISNIHIGAFKANPDSDFSPMILSEFFELHFEEFPGIKKSLAVHVYRENEIKLVTKQTEFPGRAFVADSTFLDFFDFKLVIGDRENILSDPGNIVLTRQFAENVFGPENPIGKTVSIQCDHTGSYTVAGVLEDLPSTSSMEFDFIIPKHSERRWRRIPMELILTTSAFDLDDFNVKIAKIAQVNPRFPQSVLAFFPFESIYFDRPFNFIMHSRYGNSSTVGTMSFIAIMIVLITALSFVGLQTTQQLSSIKKIGVKQVIGATLYGLFMEILVSRLFYVIIASLLAYLVYEAVFPFYTSLMEIQVDRNVGLDLVSLLSTTSIVAGVSLLISTGQIVRTNTTQALKNQLTFLKVPKMQRILTTVQYAITILLLVVTSVVFTQYNFMLNKEIGVETANVISVDFFDMISGNRTNEGRQEALKTHKYVMDKMRENPDILTFSQGIMPVDRSFDKGSWKMLSHPYDYTSINKVSVDPYYLELLGLELIQGRFFSDSIDQLLTHKAVLNETAMKYWSIEDIEGVKLANSMWGGEEDPFEVIGVVKDYHYEHLSHNIQPLILLFRSYEDYNFLVKTHPKKERQALAFLEDLYNEVNPKGIFQYELLEDRVEAQYAKEKRIGKVYFAFTLIALLLSSIGLFTFALHETKRRTKEIGIRKINGATIGQVFSLLSVSFLKSILLSFLVACPLAWILMNNWLENFAYRTPINWWVYVLAGAIALIMALVAVSWQTLKVAQKNPVESLRYE